MWTGRLSSGDLGLSDRIHNLVEGYCVTCHTIILLYRIKHLFLLYDNFHPESHNILMETKEVWFKLGTTCTCVAALGSHSKYKVPVCVDCSVFPGMTRGRVAGRIFLSGPCCCYICNGLVEFNFYFGCVEQGFLL